MKLKNFLIVVSDVEKSKAFYCGLFGLKVLRDFGENVILSGGLVLQEKKCFENFAGLSVGMEGNNAELYFEETDLAGFIKRFSESDFAIEFVKRDSDVVIIRDPDGHLIEIREER